MGGGTEAFPDLGMHCQNPDCNLLDFLPFTCDGCRKVFCAEHRSYGSHECPESDRRSRRVVVCEACSAAIEATGEDERAVLERHGKSGGCDPRRKEKKPGCPVRRCREVLTFSNASTCKACGLKVCLRHRFPADHACGSAAAAAAEASGGGRWNEKFMAALASRGGGGDVKECWKKERGSSSPPPTSTPTIKAC